MSTIATTPSRDRLRATDIRCRGRLRDQCNTAFFEQIHQVPRSTQQLTRARIAHFLARTRNVSISLGNWISFRRLTPLSPSRQIGFSLGDAGEYALPPRNHRAGPATKCGLRRSQRDSVQNDPRRNRRACLRDYVNRPDRRSAISIELMNELTPQWRRSTAAGAALLAGGNEYFCRGRRSE